MKFKIAMTVTALFTAQVAHAIPNQISADCEATAKTFLSAGSLYESSARGARLWALNRILKDVISKPPGPCANEVLQQALGDAKDFWLQRQKICLAKKGASDCAVETSNIAYIKTIEVRAKLPSPAGHEVRQKKSVTEGGLVKSNEPGTPLPAEKPCTDCEKPKKVAEKVEPILKVAESAIPRATLKNDPDTKGPVVAAGTGDELFKKINGSPGVKCKEPKSPGFQCEFKVGNRNVVIMIPSGKLNAEQCTVFFHGLRNYVGPGASQDAVLEPFNFPKLTTDSGDGQIVIAPLSRVDVDDLAGQYSQPQQIEALFKKVSELTGLKCDDLTLSGHSNGYLTLQQLATNMDKTRSPLRERALKISLFDGTYESSKVLFSSWLNRDPRRKMYNPTTRGNRDGTAARAQQIGELTRNKRGYKAPVIETSHLKIVPEEWSRANRWLNEKSPAPPVETNSDSD